MKMAIAIIGAIAGKVAEFIFLPIKKEFGYFYSCKENIKELQNLIQELGFTRDDVKNKVEEDKMNLCVIKPMTDGWLKKVDSVLAEAETIAKGVVEAKNRCLKGWCPNVKSRHSVGKKVKKMSKVLANLQAQRRNFNKLTNPPRPVGMVSMSARASGSPSSNAQMSISNPNNGSMDFESRSLTMTEIMDALRDDQVCMVGLCGMAGVGKTTMVKQVERAIKAEKLFDGFAMVTVSQQPDLIKIQTIIAEYLGLMLPEQVSLDARADRIRERLRQINKVLIILDDLWNRLDLEKIGIPVGNDHKGCKVILTSRSEDVCQKMRTIKIIKIQELEGDEAWVLFKEMAGCSVDNLDIKDIAKKIVKKCQGLPLALVTIGRALGSKDKCEWNNALRQLTMPCQATLIGVHEEVYPSLLLSYNYIASEEAKLLFNLCCLFPEDFEIPIEELFRYGEGKQLFEGKDHLHAARDYAFSLIKDLKRRNLLLEGQDENHVKIHDVVREFGISISSKRIWKAMSLISRDENLKQWPNKETFENYTCVSLITNAMAELPQGINCSSLELLMLFHNDRVISLPKNFFERIGALKVLNLRNMSIVMQVPSLGLLKDLRTLCIQDCRRIEIISTIGELINLEILSFRDSMLHEIPKEIGNLTNLKLLDLTHCCYLERISPGVISSLIRLEELYIGTFNRWEVEGEVKRRQNASLNELEHLSYLNTLEICVSNPATLPRSPIFSKLAKYSIVVGGKNGLSEDCRVFERKLILKKLNKIESLFGGIDVLFKNTELLTLCDMESEDIVGEAIQDGLHNLKYLTVWNCKTTKILEICNCPLPKLTSSLSHLTSVKIRECHGLENLFPLSMVCDFVQLKCLEVSNCNMLKEIFSNKSEQEVNDHKKIKFPNLQKLELTYLPKFTSFCKAIKEIEFPKLDILKVYELPNLRSLFSNTTLYALFPIKVNFHCPVTLNICWMKNLTEIWETKHQAGSYIKLHELFIYGCPKLEKIITSNALTRLHKLQSLYVNSCNSLEEIVIADQRDGEHTEEADGIIIMLPALRSLRLENLPNLKSFYHKRPSSSNTPILIQHHLFNKQVSFLGLETLVLHKLDSIDEIWCKQHLKGSFHKITLVRVKCCNKLRKLGPSSMATSTLQLHKLVVGECSKMEEVFGNEGNAEQGTSRISTPLFPQLCCVKLVNMLKLRRFCHMSHDWELPSLCQVKMSNCPNMKSFSPSFVNTPCLAHLLITDEFGEKEKKVWIDNINDTLRYICKQKTKEFLTGESVIKPICEESSSSTDMGDLYQLSMVKVKASLKTGVAWSYPPPGWVKLNSHAIDYYRPTVGGVLRQDNGIWVIGFTGMLDIKCKILTAKLLAIRQGLEIAWERRIPALVVETDSVKAINLIQHTEISDDSLEIGSLVKDCRVLMRKKPWQCVIHYNWRKKANKAAKYLANIGRKANRGVISILNDPPPGLLKVLNKETKEEDADEEEEKEDDADEEENW